MVLEDCYAGDHFLSAKPEQQRVLYTLVVRKEAGRYSIREITIWHPLTDSLLPNKYDVCRSKIYVKFE